MSSGKFTVLVVVAAVVAIVAVVVLNGGIGGGDDDEQPGEPARTEAQVPTEAEPVEVEAREIPENPDDVRGSDPFSLTRPANLRRALAVLERRRQAVEGVYDHLRIAPGRIDTVIVHPDDRRTNIQVQADFEVSFENTHDFPTPADFRDTGITGADVDIDAPARLLREIDGMRRGSAAHDVDYFVASRDGSVGAYMRIRTPRPRMFSKEPGQPARAIG